MTELPKVLEGVYRSFDEVPAKTGYNSEEYLRGLLIYCEQRADELKAGVFPQSLARNIQNNILIAVVASMLRWRKLRVLDFGGGMGQSFVTVAAGIPNYTGRLDYVVCDLPDTVAYIRANDIYRARGIACIRFTDNLNEVDRRDLVYIGGTLQFIPDISTFLRAIFRLRPLRILLTQTPLTMQVPTFVTAQINVPGIVQPYRVFNSDELTAIFSAGGYRLIGRSCEFEGDAPNRFHNFPAEYWDYRRAMLLFAR